MTQNKQHTLWVERYRPVDLENYIGNEHLKTKVSKYIYTGDIPHLLLHGKAGTGKTTLAKLLVSNVDCDQMYVNASDENNVETVRNKIKMFASSVGFKDLKVIINNTIAVMKDKKNVLVKFNKVEEIIAGTIRKITIYKIRETKNLDFLL